MRRSASRVRIAWLVLVLVVDLNAGRVLAGPTYAITDLGSGILPTGTSPGGQLFGTAEGEPYLYANGQKNAVPGLSFGSSIVAMTDNGLLIGNLPNGHAFLAANGVVTDLGTLGGSSSNAAGVNASGMVVGDAQTSSGSYTAFLSNTTMQNLGTLGGTSSYASAINGTGLVVGGAQLASGNQHAFLFQNGRMIDLGTLGGSDSGASAINNSGQIAGSSKLADGVYHAFLVSGGTMIDLGSLGGSSYGFAINSSGEVVGSATIPGSNNSFVNHAFVASPSGMLDLNGLIPNLPTGWVLNTATGIDDSGNIVAQGTVNGVPHGFLLSPIQPASVPEPTLLVFFAIVPALGLGRSRRSRLDRGIAIISSDRASL